jgi:2-phospho-L-lactate guanylyltransferase
MPERWTAVLPFKGNGRSKTRLDLPQAQQLAQQWLTRALDCCLQSPSIEATWVVSLGGQLELPVGVGWMRQAGPGLNEGLNEWYCLHRPERWLVILPDLPELQVQDLEELLARCPVRGLGLAPDRHLRGCNALAVRGCLPELVFGADSFERFQAQALNEAVVQRRGLANDVDTLDDWNCLACQHR